MDLSATPQLSTDFLNRYSEALMLIEMVSMDDTLVEDLKCWRSISYRDHFNTSSLRCAASALAAYDRVPAVRRAGFEKLCSAMTRLVTTVTALLSEAPDGLDRSMVVEVAAEALRKLMGRATQFINANGSIDIGSFDDFGGQSEIDRLLAN